MTHLLLRQVEEVLGAGVDLLVEAAALVAELTQWVDDLPELLELGQLFSRHLGSAPSPGLEVRQHLLFLQQREDLPDSQHVGHLHYIALIVLSEERFRYQSIPC